MEFQFPGDEELFADLQTVRTEMSYELENLVDGHRDGSKPAFGEAFREVIGEIRATPAPKLSASGYSASQVIHELRTRREAHFRSLYEKLEAVAARFAEKNHIGAFPSVFMDTITYTNNSGNSTKYELDYFSEMDKAFGFMDGAGRAGDFLKSAQAELNTIEKKVPLIARSTLIVLLVGAVVCLAGAMPFPFLPQIVAELVNTSRIVRLVVLAAMTLTGWYLVMVGPPDKKLKGRFLFKFVSGGIFLLAAAFGSTLITLAYAFSKAPLEYFVLLPFGLYYVLHSLIKILEDMRQFVAAKKAARRAKKEFCAQVERNIESLHRYLRFHILWWQAQFPEVPFPSGIENLEKSFEHLLKKYKLYR